MKPKPSLFLHAAAAELAEAIVSTYSENGEYNAYTGTHSPLQIRKLAMRVAKLAATPPRVVAVVKGGIVTDMFASDPATNASVLDRDVLEEGDPTLEQDRIEEAQELEKEIKTLIEVR